MPPCLFNLCFHVRASTVRDLHPARRQHRHLHHPRRPNVRIAESEMV